MSSENIRRGRTAPKQAIPRDRGPAKDDPPPACGSPYTDNLALALSATATTMATQNFSLFNYAHPFYALIDSEIVLVKSGMGSPTWTIVRGQLGTTAAAHILGAAVTVAQTSATDSPISNVDIGDLSVSDPAERDRQLHPRPGQRHRAIAGRGLAGNRGDGGRTIRFRRRISAAQLHRKY